MKLKIGNLYQMNVSGLNNPDESLVSETLEIKKLSNGDCEAVGLGSSHCYKIKEDLFISKILAEHKYHNGIESILDKALIAFLSLALLFLAIVL